LLKEEKRNRGTVSEDRVYSGILKWNCVSVAVLLVVACRPAIAQQPFYTDDPGTTASWQLHIELFNEFDLLQPELRPSLRQNTFNYKINFGLPHNLELNFDNTVLGIFRSLETVPRRSFGRGDTNLGVKWNFYEAKDTSWLPTLGVSFYSEFPTGDPKQQLGSGLIDYWLNGIGQKKITEKIRMNANLGIVFAGNTSTGLVGIQTTRGRVYAGGVSIIREMTPKLEMGVETFGGVTQNFDLGRSQLQFLLGGKYELRSGMTFDFGVLGGTYVGSPRAGLQFGISWDVVRFGQHAPAAPGSGLVSSSPRFRSKPNLGF
jgi:hypothetical protein